MAGSRGKTGAISAKFGARDLRAHLAQLRRLDRPKDACVITREVANAARAWSYQADRS